MMAQRRKDSSRAHYRRIKGDSARKLAQVQWVWYASDVLIMGVTV